MITSVLTEIKRNDRNRHGEEYVNLHFRICETGQKVYFKFNFQFKLLEEF